MTRTVEDSLRTVHHTQREAGLALGLSRWETICHVVVPEALPGIVTGIVLASGRIFGEAAALIYTAGQSAPALNWSNWNRLVYLVQYQFSVNLRHLLFTSGRSTQKVRHLTPLQYLLVRQQYSLIFILIFNFGARRLGAYLHKKLTSA